MIARVCVCVRVVVPLEQGLNFIVAHLLRWLGEEEAFWVLVQVIETLQPDKYYSLMVCVCMPTVHVWWISVAYLGRVVCL